MRPPKGAGLALLLFVLLLSAAGCGSGAAGPPEAPGASQALGLPEGPESPMLSATLATPNGHQVGEFGESVAVDDKYVVVGAWGESVNGLPAAGDVHVYSKAGGKLLYTLASPRPEKLATLGGPVAVSGNLIVVGAWDEGSAACPGVKETGNVYVYEASTGKLLRALTSPKPMEEGRFGLSVAVEGEDVAVGSREPADGHKEAGDVYLFNGVTGALLREFTSPNAQPEGRFGISDALSGEELVVGAYGETVGGHPKAGMAYVFNAGTGRLLHTLTSPTPQEYGTFGSSLAVSGEDLVVGASGQPNGGMVGAGYAYVFNLGSGKLLQTLSDPKPAKYGGFPSSVAISGQDVLAGVQLQTVDGRVNAGAADLFDASSGQLLKTLTSPNPQEHREGTFLYGGQFGDNVAISGPTAVVGAKRETSQKLPQGGNAYIFAVPNAKASQAATAPAASLGSGQPVVLRCPAPSKPAKG